MTAPLAHTDTLVLDYLATLWAASEDLPPEARDDLMQTVANYITLRQDLAEDPALVLGRLGPPEQLAAAVRRGGMPTHLRLPASFGPASFAAGSLGAGSLGGGSLGGGSFGGGSFGGAAGLASAPSTGGGPEHAAITLLLAGTFVLPVVGPMAGLLVATGSGKWTPAQKAAAWILTTGSAAGALLCALVLAGFGSGGGLFFLTLYLGCCAGAVAAGQTLRMGLRVRG
ncbi:hypothetical protein [Actinoplanes sp. GCM10030250]|uniref:HAAS signaling domain-containing protein n=1 Tax=Actinoplanes sp. GCM10030250 TaxID=3273376 RepID=UPI003624419D